MLFRSPVAVCPDSQRVLEGFRREDLFCVVMDSFLTDTADYADLVLPATTQLEHVDIHKSYRHFYVLANNPAIAPVGESLPNSEVFRRLAARMGYAEPCFRDSDEDIARQAQNVYRMKLLGATVVPVTSGSRTLKDALNEAMRDWVTKDRKSTRLNSSH